MKRSITLYDENNKPINQSNDYIHIQNVDNIVNFSVDDIFCDCIDGLNEENANATIQKIFQKLRVGGYAHLKILDIKELCIDVVQNKIPLNRFIQLVKNKNSIATLDTIAANIDFNKFEITKIANEQHQINLIIKRSVL